MLSVKALSFAFAVLWAATVFGVGILNLVWPGYAVAFLDMVKSIYPGYAGVSGFGGVIVGTLYALVDGAVGGAIFGWLYNLMRAEKATGAPTV
jgi:hypothetical protein